jgi:hypothetical protein
LVSRIAITQFEEWCILVHDVLFHVEQRALFFQFATWISKFLENVLNPYPVGLSQTN